MILSISVEAGKKRKSPCKRFFGIFSFITFLFSPEVQAQPVVYNNIELFSFQSRVQSFFCSAESRPAPLHVAADACNLEAVSRYLNDGHDPSVEAECYFLHSGGQRTMLPKATAKILAKTTETIARGRGDRVLSSYCSETISVLGEAIRERDL